MDNLQKERPPWKIFLKRSFYNLHHYYLHLKKKDPPKILFYPHLPGWKTAIHQILMNQGVGLTDNPSDVYTMAIFWDDRTFRRRREKLESLNDFKIINYHCTDISKEKVEDVFEQVFGYSLRVAPNSTGTILRKSNFNGQHDGKILQGPVKEEGGFVYEKLLNNQVAPDLFQDLRIGYFNGIIPLVSPRFHNRKDRFGKIIEATVEKVENYLSEEEVKLIQRFCRQLGFDYGDLDLIRDRNDQRLYIVDANPTPTVPSSAAMEPHLRRLMIKKWAESFKKAFLDSNNQE